MAGPEFQRTPLYTPSSAVDGERRDARAPDRSRRLEKKNNFTLAERARDGGVSMSTPQARPVHGRYPRPAPRRMARHKAPIDKLDTESTRPAHCKFRTPGPNASATCRNSRSRPRELPRKPEKKIERLGQIHSRPHRTTSAIIAHESKRLESRILRCPISFS